MSPRSAEGVLDALVIGGGFYGTSLAAYLVERRGLSRVTLVERESTLLARASYANQARIHAGYHYPRSFTTAFRSRVNLPRFVADFPEATRQDLTSLYAIARGSSKVTAPQFERFCRDIGAPLQPAPAALVRLFEPRLVEAVYAVDEFVFDATVLRTRAVSELARLGVTDRLGARVTRVEAASDDTLAVHLDAGGGPEVLRARHVIGCAYAGSNDLVGGHAPTRTVLKHEITEMGLVKVPDALRDVGITVMDGPFFSCMPFPARGLHTLSHVRYTPHLAFADEPGRSPYDRLDAYEKTTRTDRMLRDASRYVPSLASARVEDSLFEVKTVLRKNEGDDGRPILVERSTEVPRLLFVLGGKIDNVYDVFERLDRERFD